MTVSIYDHLRRLWVRGHREAVARWLARNAFHALEFADLLDPLDRRDLTLRIGEAEVRRETPITSGEVDALIALARGEGA